MVHCCPLVRSGSAHTAVTAVMASLELGFSSKRSHFVQCMDIVKPQGKAQGVTAIIMSLLRVSVALNLNMYSSSNVMNSIPTNKGSDVSSQTTIIPSMDVTNCKSTYC